MKKNKRMSAEWDEGSEDKRAYAQRQIGKKKKFRIYLKEEPTREFNTIWHKRKENLRINGKNENEANETENIKPKSILKSMTEYTKWLLLTLCLVFSLTRCQCNIYILSNIGNNTPKKNKKKKKWEKNVQEKNEENCQNETSAKILYVNIPNLFIQNCVKRKRSIERYRKRNQEKKNCIPGENWNRNRRKVEKMIIKV